MLVKVRNKATKQAQVITQKAYNLAKKRFEYIGPAPEGSDLDGQIAEVKNETIPSVNQESPNLTTTAQKEEKKGAEAVAGSAPKVAAKRGPKPKDKNQISSQAAASES